ncbi:FecR family protein [Carboxylicivirga sp. N1Y90]|uniref:FecR family protein n=1 Tax=Carboxylicivirga fragile TaxID=3417571 RepID=UPI003D357AEE|nr:FecR domain-containing protein [Marinilabiliaceae bacterium N1Y90]
MKEVLNKYIHGNCSKEELKEVLQILRDSNNSNQLKELMRQHWVASSESKIDCKHKDFDAVLHKIHHEINLKEPTVSPFFKFYKSFSKAAAILLLPLLLLLGYKMIQTQASSGTMLSMKVPYGVQSELVLPDGSKVWLNSGTEIKYPSTFKGGQRHVELSGEALFEVHQNKLKPFIVNTNGIDVKVLGTTFNVSAYNNDPEVSVALLEGSVVLGQYKDGKMKELSSIVPNQYGRFIKSANKLYLNKDVHIERFAAWKDGKMVCVDEPFDSVLRRMARRYNVNYSISNNKVLQYRITGTFMYETLDQFLKILVTSSPIQYEIKQGTKRADGSFNKREVIIK